MWLVGNGKVECAGWNTAVVRRLGSQCSNRQGRPEDVGVVRQGRRIEEDARPNLDARFFSSLTSDLSVDLQCPKKA